MLAYGNVVNMMMFFQLHILSKRNLLTPLSRQLPIPPNPLLPTPHSQLRPTPRLSRVVTLYRPRGDILHSLKVPTHLRGRTHSNHHLTNQLLKVLHS